MSAEKSISANVLVVDDEPDLRTLYELTLLREGYQVEIAADLKQARELLAGKKFAVVITDMRLPDGLGLELIAELANRSERCIVVTAYGSAENAVTALKSGAFDYLSKPVDLRQFRMVVASAVQDGMQRSNQNAWVDKPKVVVPQSTLDRIVGASATMESVKTRITKVARSMAPVLVLGESGAGKELVARAVHDCSHRSDAAFVAVNCGAIPENLLEAEFFGAKKGSYTGATQERVGFFQAASGGTLFLDEIGDLPLIMQTKLLRAIQERCVRPLGTTQEEAVDVRIVSATHKNLAAEVAAGRFRQDLYYRLHVIEIQVPSLRERREDIPALSEALLARIANDSGLDPVPRLSTRALAQLTALPLPGNVRELENILHRAMAMSEGEELELDLPTQSPSEMPEGADVRIAPGLHSDEVPSDLQRYLDDKEREILVRALKEANYNRTAAAAKLGMNLRQMRYRIARLHIEMPGDGAEPQEGFL
jgi:two-component system, NtrC family, response regulator PilR